MVVGDDTVSLINRLTCVAIHFLVRPDPVGLVCSVVGKEMVEWSQLRLWRLLQLDSWVVWKFGSFEEFWVIIV